MLWFFLFQQFQSDQIIIFRENLMRFGKTNFQHRDDATIHVQKYSTLVPPHGPTITRYALIGEVVFTQYCQAELMHFYNQSCNQGTKFRWVYYNAILLHVFCVIVIASYIIHIYIYLFMSSILIFA